MLTQKLVIMVGGAGLLGKQLSRAAVSQGATVIIADRDVAGAETVAREIISDYPERAIPAAIDITSGESIATILKEVGARHGRIDAVVNAAYPRNHHYGRAFEHVSYRDFCENVDLHLGGYFLVMQQFGLFFRAQGGGNIVNLASIYGTIVPRFELYEGTPMTMPVEYAAIKAGIIHLTRYCAEYFKQDGIRVNCLSPGGIYDSQPASFVGRYNAECGTKGMLSPRDIEGSLVFLLSDASRFMTGQNLIVDDGFSL